MTIQSALVIAGCPRSGTTLLYNLLSEVPSLWSLGYESKAIIERYHHPRVKGWVSGALDAADLTEESRAWMLAAFEQGAAPGMFWRRVNRLRAGLRANPLWQAVKRQGRRDSPAGAVGAALPQGGLGLIRELAALQNRVRLSRGERRIRLLEKTPENCLRLPFLEALFPEMRVIYLIRDGRANVSSLMEGWREPHLFPGYRVPREVRIPGDTRGRWAFTLIPGWEALLERPLEEVCARQWIACNAAVLEHEAQGRVPYLRVRYEDLIARPETTLRQIAAFIGESYERAFGHLGGRLPQINAVSAPEAEKWRRQNGAAIERVLPLMAEMMERLGYG